MVLVLWDVDHTLIESGGVGSSVFADAFAAATGCELVDAAQVQGALEPQLFAASCAANGVPGDPAELFPVFAAAQAWMYQERAAELRERGRVLPGVREALAALAAAGAVNTVLSGNTAAAGPAKLAAFGLGELLDLSVAAWGTDAAARSGLVPVAWERARAKYGEDFGAERTVSVGDTVNDVAAGAANGIRTIGVATGRAGVLQLRSAGAHRVFEDLADTRAVVAAVLGSNGTDHTV